MNEPEKEEGTELISIYRSFKITKDEDGTVYADKLKFNSPWSAICWIDEKLAP